MSSPRSDDTRLETLALEITDATPIDWDAQRESDHRETMQLIDDVFRAHRMMEDPPSADEPSLFHWGGLDVREKIAEGGFGEVYRAFDPRLQRSVALKLRKEDSAASARAWIEEARSLARLRHPNVLHVYDAAVHEERAGIVTELLQGVTLEEELSDGPLAHERLVPLARSLARALGAVHRAGLVHGDVKTSNVLREADGRLVLMDFGSTTRGLATGTPLFAAPEILAGESPTEASDVFSLAVLLARMAGGGYPYPASSLEELRQRQQLAPELPSALPPELDRLIRQALSADPERRPSLVEFAALESPLPTAAHKLHWLWAVPAVALAIFVMTLLQPSGVVDVQQSALLHVAGGSDQTLLPQTRLSAGDHLAYRFGANEDLHVYVLNEDRHGESFVLFPAPHLDLSNPLPGGEVHRLPGASGGESFDWVVSSAGGAETFLVVACREPLEILDAEIARLKTAHPDRAPAYAALTPEIFEGLRGVGGMAPTSETGSRQGRLADLARTLRGVDDDLWLELMTVDAD